MRFKGMNKATGTRRRSVVSSSYRVRVAPVPTVVDEEDAPVADAFIISIRFPREAAETSAGHVPVVTGAGVARILVGSTTVRGVPLC